MGTVETCSSTDAAPITAATGDPTAYLAAYAHWLRVGKPGPAPSAIAYGLHSCDHTMAVCDLDAAFTRFHGLSHWNFYNPDFYDPMMQLRRDEHAAGRDPDAAVVCMLRNTQ